MINRTIQSVLFLASLVTILLGCNNNEKKVIKVGYLPIIAHLPASVAFDEKKFEGLSIEFTVYPNSNDLLNDLQSGKIDVATTLAMAPIIQLTNKLKKDSKSLELEIFSYSKTTSEDPFDGIFVKDSSKIKALSDLKGKRIGVFPGSTAKNILSYFLLKNFEIQNDQIEYVSLPPSAQVDALRSGDIDALFTYETIRTLLESQGFRQISGSIIAKVLENAPYGCSAINKKFRMENPKLADIFIEGFDNGIISVRENPDNARKVLVSSLGVTSEIASKCHLEKRVTSKELKNNLPVLDQFIELIIKIEGLDNNGEDIKATSLIIQ